MWRKRVGPIVPAYRTPTEATRIRMQHQRRSDTGPEVAVRKVLHAKGLRFRKGEKLLDDRRTVDIVPSDRVAVFIDGCFWHGCPDHARPTKSNTLWWADKIQANKRRDAKTTTDLEREGWVVLRYWDHEDPEAIAKLVAEVIDGLREVA